MKSKVMLIFCLVSILLLTTGAVALTANGINSGWQQVNQSGFGSLENESVMTLRALNGYLYAGTINEESGGQIWKMDKNDNWVSLMDDGFGEDYNIGVFDLVQFKSKIYAGTFGGEIWRTQNGNNWNQVVTGGFGHPSNAVIAQFLVFKDKLYCGTGSLSDTEGGEIWRSVNGNTGSWEQIAENGIDGNPDNKVAISFTEFKDYMYVSTYNEESGTEIWRTPDGDEGEQSNADGFGDPLNVGAYLEPYKDYLYAGTTYFTEGPDAGAELWRCKTCGVPGNWEKVPIQKGFGDSDNMRIVPLAGPDGRLYAIVSNIDTGIQVWGSNDGVNFSQINQDGFGDSMNRHPFPNANRFYRSFLYTGTSNETTGGQVWKRAFLNLLPFAPK